MENRFEQNKRLKKLLVTAMLIGLGSACGGSDVGDVEEGGVSDKEKRPVEAPPKNLDANNNNSNSGNTVSNNDAAQNSYPNHANNQHGKPEAPKEKQENLSANNKSSKGGNSVANNDFSQKQHKNPENLSSMSDKSRGLSAGEEENSFGKKDGSIEIHPKGGSDKEGDPKDIKQQGIQKYPGKPRTIAMKDGMAAPLDEDLKENLIAQENPETRSFPPSSVNVSQPFNQLVGESAPAYDESATLARNEKPYPYLADIEQQRKDNAVKKYVVAFKSAIVNFRFDIAHKELLDFSAHIKDNNVDRNRIERVAKELGTACDLQSLGGELAGKFCRFQKDEISWKAKKQENVAMGLVIDMSHSYYKQ